MKNFIKNYVSFQQIAIIVLMAIIYDIFFHTGGFTLDFIFMQVSTSLLIIGLNIYMQYKIINMK